MSKTLRAVPLALNPPKDGLSLFDWLCSEIRAAILKGNLKRGARLPSSRTLAEAYGVSRGVVVLAYEQLSSEGYLHGHTGSGTEVRNILPEDYLHPRNGTGERATILAPPGALSKYAKRIPVFPDTRQGPPRAFRIFTPAFDAFPLQTWTKIATRRLRRATRNLLADSDSKGYLPLREAVASYLGTARGVVCEAHQVMITAGIQQGLDLTARIVLDPGDSVVVEDPGAPIVKAMFAAMGLKIVPRPVEQDGIKTARLPRARLAYVTPANQFPLGVVMSAERRMALLEWARRSGALIFEDDYDSEYRYAGRPVPALQSLDRHGCVVYAGSFSKVLFPSLRLGYLAIPEAYVDLFGRARTLMDRHSSLIDQAILCDFITEGHFGRHIRRMRELYSERLQLLRAHVRQKLAGALSLSNTEAGVHVVGWLHTGRAEKMSALAAAQNVEVIALSRFLSQSKQPEGILLGFAAVDDREMKRGVDVLASLVERPD